MENTLIVVDMQNDFIDGALGTKEAQAIVSNVANKIKKYKDVGKQVIFTRDTHPENYLNTYEGKHLPVGCYTDPYTDRIMLYGPYKSIV